MKTFKQFVSETGTGGSPYQPYKTPPQPAPSAPPEGWDEFKKKYLPKQAKK